MIGAVTKPGDLVVDTAAGGFVVLRAATALGRKFIGCDIAHHKEDQPPPDTIKRAPTTTAGGRKWRTKSKSK